MQYQFKHNNLISGLIREEEENFNQIFLNSLKLDLDIKQYEAVNNKDIDSDSTSYMTVWLKNIDRLMELIPDNIKLENYHLCDVGCGLGISTIYFALRYNLKSYCGFDFNKKLIREANYIKNNIGKKINFEVANANEKRLEEKPQLLFMFNPFGVKTLNNFINNNEQNLRNNKSIILYANDLWINEIEKSTLINRNHFFNLSSIEF
tara:strand:- start:18489 stop:19106 length:618 start_codon:yes stop_codon:yes gene_type:complete